MRSTTQMWLGSTANINGIKIGAAMYDAQEPAGEQHSVPTYFTYASHWWKKKARHLATELGVLASQIDGRWLINDEGTG